MVESFQRGDLSGTVLRLDDRAVSFRVPSSGALRLKGLPEAAAARKDYLLLYGPALTLSQSPSPFVFFYGCT